MAIKIKACIFMGIYFCDTNQYIYCDKSSDFKGGVIHAKRNC